MTTMVDELKAIQKCLKNEYCFELAKRLYQIYVIIMQCPISDYNQADTNERVGEIDSDIRLLEEIKLNPMGNYSGRRFYSEDLFENNQNLKKYLSLLIADISDVSGDVDSINTEYIDSIISELKNKRHELTDSLSLDHVKEADAMKNALDRAISQIFALDIPERQKLVRVTQMLDNMTEDQINKMSYKVCGMRSINKEIKFKNRDNSVSGKPISMVVAKNMSSNEEATCFSSDVMSVKACYNPSILYIYFNLLDIADNRIDWVEGRVNEMYRVTAKDILEFDSRDKLRNLIKKLLVVLSIFKNSTFTPVQNVTDSTGTMRLYRDGWMSCFDWKRSFVNVRSNCIDPKLEPVTEGNNPKDRVSYYRNLHNCAISICGNKGITGYKSLKTSMRTSDSNNKSLDALPIEESSRNSVQILLRLCEMGDPRVNRLQERNKTVTNGLFSYVPKDISIYNIIPHIFICFDEDRMFFIPVGNLKSYKVIDQDSLNSDISMASFMYQTTGTKNENSANSVKYFYYQDIDTLGAKYNPLAIEGFCNEINELGRGSVGFNNISMMLTPNTVSKLGELLTPQSRLLLKQLTGTTISQMGSKLSPSRGLLVSTVKELLLEQECLQATEDSALCRLCNYDGYTNKNIDAHTRRLHSVEIIADEHNFGDLWLLSIDSNGDLSSEISSYDSNNYITYSNEELGEIIDRIKSKTVFTETTDDVKNTVDRNISSIFNNSSLNTGDFSYIRDSKTDVIIKRTESLAGNVYICISPEKKNIEYRYDDIIYNEVISPDGTTNFPGPSRIVKVKSSAFTNQQRFGAMQIQPIIKFPKQEQTTVLQPIDIIGNSESGSAFSVSNSRLSTGNTINLLPAKVVTNTRDALMQLLEKYKKSLDQSRLPVDDLLYDYIFDKHKQEILGTYFSKLHRQLQYDIKNYIKPIIDGWCDSNDVSGNIEAVMLRNIVDYGKTVTGSISETVTSIPRSVIDTMVNVLLLLCKCGKDENISFYKLGSNPTMMQIADIKSLELSSNTLDYNKITLQDLWGYNIAYDNANTALSGGKETKKAYLEGTDMSVTFKLSDKELGSVTNSLVRLMYGVTNLADTIPEEKINTVVNVTREERKAEEDMDVVTEKDLEFYKFFNVSDDDHANSTTIFDWDKLIDWDNSLINEADTEESKRSIFNSWMREYINYISRVARWYQELFQANERSSGTSLSPRYKKYDSIDKDLHVKLIISAILKVVYDSRLKSDGKKPTVDEWFNHLFYRNSDLPEMNFTRTMDCISVYDDYILDNSVLIGDVILYCNGIYKSNRLSTDITNKYKATGDTFKATESSEEDLNRFDAMCKVVMAYNNISEAIIARFISKIDTLVEETKDNFTFTEDQLSDWLSDIGAYSPDKYIRKQAQSIRMYKPTYSKVPDEEYQFATDPTFSRDCAMIYRVMNTTDFKALCSVAKGTEVICGKSSRKQRVDLSQLSINELVNMATDVMRIKLDRNNYQMTYTADGLYEQALKIIGKLDVALNEEVRNHIAKTFATKVLSICQTGVEICLALMSLNSKVSVLKKKSDTFDISDIFEGRRFKPEVKSSEIDDLRSRLQATAHLVFIAENLREFCFEQDLIDISALYHKTRQDARDKTYLAINRANILDKDKKRANLCFKFYLETGDKKNYVTYLNKEKLNYVDEELLFCDNWDSKYRVPSPFSVRALTRSLANLDLSNPNLNKSLLSDDTYKPSILFESYAEMLRSADPSYNDIVQTYKRIVDVLLSGNQSAVDANGIQQIDIFAVYDAFAQAYMQMPEASDYEITEEAWKIYDAANIDISQAEKQIVYSWFNTCHELLDEPVLNECEQISATYNKDMQSEYNRMAKELRTNRQGSALDDGSKDNKTHLRLKEEAGENAARGFSEDKLENVATYKLVRAFLREVTEVYMSLLSYPIEEIYRFTEITLKEMFYESLNAEEDTVPEREEADVKALEREFVTALSDLPDILHVKMTKYVASILSYGATDVKNVSNIEDYNKNKRLYRNKDRFVFDYDLKVEPYRVEHSKKKD